jgi:tetratricopeptide (TPR) repeat protein
VRIFDSERVARQGDVAARSNTEFFLAAIAGTRGRIAESLRHLAISHAAEREFGSRTADIDAATDSAVYLAFHMNRPEEGARILDRALASHPLDSVSIEDRPLTTLIEAYTLAKRPDRAKALLAQLDRRLSESPLTSDDQDRVVAGAQIALAEGRYADAIRDLRAANATGCAICRWPEIGRAYDAAGQPDSAIAAFERYVNGVAPGRIVGDVNGLASSMLRTAELYDAKGNAEKAASYYARFVDLWKNADPELQPTVKKARDRLQQLQRKTG